MARLFGTDGVRGVANRDLTAELALQLAAAAASVLGGRGAESSYRAVALVGRDPRASGEFLEAAVVAGLASRGVDVLRLGVLPTPGVAYLTAASGADFAVMLSASHNPMPDNGIKFFGRGGQKLDDRDEDAIESALNATTFLPTGAGVGRVTDLSEALRRYVDHLTSTIDQSLAGLTVVLDCANGAAYRTAPLAFAGAGADVIAIHDSPDGLGINDGCGSMHPEALREAVISHGADCGFAFDGDADRCVAVDASGEVVDGDQLLALLAVAMREAGSLVDDTVVATVMSNLGFLQAMTAHGVNVIRAKVGDRYVLKEMRTGGYTLGGEQSGHVIMSAHASTGDGVLTALHVAARMASTGREMADLAAVMSKLPQVLLNVSGVDRSRIGIDAVVLAAVERTETTLGDRGRVLLRPSGTEDLVRVMVEAETLDEARAHAERIADVVRAELALPAG